jgi:hypothetical protein
VIDQLKDALMMVTHIEGLVKEIDKMFNNGYKNLCRQFGLQEEERLD